MANLGKVPQINVEDRLLNQIQNNIVQRVNQLIGLPILQGAFLDAVVLASGNNTINHLLGRALLGWIITLQNAASTIYDTQSTNTDIANTLILNSSAAVTVTIYVF